MIYRWYMVYDVYMHAWCKYFDTCMHTDGNWHKKWAFLSKIFLYSWTPENENNLSMISIDTPIIEVSYEPLHKLFSFSGVHEYKNIFERKTHFLCRPLICIYLYYTHITSAYLFIYQFVDDMYIPTSLSIYLYIYLSIYQSISVRPSWCLELSYLYLYFYLLSFKDLEHR